MELAVKLVGALSALVALAALGVAAWHTWHYECHRHRQDDR